MKKSKVILPIVSTVLISSTLLNTNVFADAKKGIHELEWIMNLKYQN